MPSTDNGNFWINDILFSIPPTAIKVRRNSVVNYWNTLRTKSSIKLPSGFSNLDIAVNMTLKSSIPEDMIKLRDLVSQVRVTPFCYVDNQYLRNAILAGQPNQTMMLALRQMSIRDETSGTRDSDLLSVTLYFAWFNYFPFAKDIRFKQDIMVPKAVNTPNESRAWKLLYTSEQERGKYADDRVVRSIGSDDGNIILDLTQFMLVNVRSYMQTKQDLVALQLLLRSLKDGTIPPTIEGTELPGGLPEQFFKEMVDTVGSQGELERLLEEAFGHTTSMNWQVTDPDVRAELENLVAAKERWLDAYGQVASLGQFRPTQIELPDGRRTTVELQSEISLNVNDKREAGERQAGDQILMQQGVQLNFRDMRIFPTMIDISFENILASIPVLGHAYPTYQHIGSNDAVVNISMMTAHDAGLQALSAFYTIAEQQIRKMRQVPQHRKNIRIYNSLLQLCGLTDFVLEEANFQTVPGQPGTYMMSISLVNNPIEFEDQEKFIAGQSFTSRADIRRDILAILDREVKFNKDQIELEFSESYSTTQIHAMHSGSTAQPRKVNVVTVGAIPIGQKKKVSFGWKDVGDVAVGAASNPFVGAWTFLKKLKKGYDFLTNDINSIYSIKTTADNRDMAFRHVCIQYGLILNEAFHESFVTGILQHPANSSNYLSTAEAAKFFSLTEDQVLGITRLQKDVYDSLLALEGKNKILTAQQVETPILNYQRANYISERADSTKRQQGETEQEHRMKAVQAYRDGLTSATTSLHNQIYQFWQQRKDSGGIMSPEEEEQYHKIVEGYDQFSEQPFDTIVKDWANSIFDSHRKRIVQFVDNLLRSPVFLLDEFKEIRDKMGNPLGIEPGQTGYPDFPLSLVAQKLSNASPSLAQKLQDQAWTKDLHIYNVGIEGLIEPDFYFFNPQADSVGEVIPRQSFEKTINAISDTIDGQRRTSEDDWMTRVYESQIIGSDRNATIERNVREARQKYAPRHGGDEKQSWYDIVLKSNKPEGLKTGLRKIKSLEEKIGSKGEHFHFQDFDGEKIKPFSTTKGSIDLRPISEESDTRSLFGSDRSKGPIRPAAHAYQITHQFDEPISYHPEPSNYHPPPPPDPNEVPEFNWPIKGAPHNGFIITSGFGPRVHPVTKEEGKIHKGIDLAVPGRTIQEARENTRATLVYPVAPGKIVYVGKAPWSAGNGSAGNYMVIRHSGGYWSAYMHLQWDEFYERYSRIKHGAIGFEDPEPLLQVDQNTPIGKIGNTGIGTGPHLHLEIRRTRDGNQVNPLEVIEQGVFKSPGPIAGWNPNAESLFTKSIEQFEKELQGGQGYSMMRAYPTFKLYFIESDIGERRRFAFDDFFSYSSVVDIEVIRSRKIAADLAIIRLTNVSGKLSNRKFRGQGNEDRARNIRGELIEENPNNVELTNTAQENPIASLMLQPGVEMQLRLGYTANPQALERVLNGVITDVSFTPDEDIVQIICQSHAIEMVQSIQGEATEYGGWFSGTGDTGTLLEEMMASPELVHFGRWEAGDPDDPNTARSLLKARYQLQPTPADDNIFAPPTHGVFVTLGTPNYIMYRTTIWDVFQEMCLRHPGYVAYPVPYDGQFGARMTMYFGLPDQLYFARDPTPKEDQSLNSLASLIADTRDDLDVLKDETIPNSKVPIYIAEEVEGNRTSDRVTEALQSVWAQRTLIKHAKDQGYIRPFRSYHILTSSMHIVQNSITSTSWNTFNTVTIQYEDDDPDVNDDLGRLTFEDEETFTLKCDAGLPDNEKREMMASFPNCIGEDMAKRYCLTLLKDSLKEGYKGTITIIGNPSIKPHDICYIFDEYNDMFGPIEVEQVVHKFSQQHGFITEITPDMCIHVNQMSTLKTSQAMGLMAEEALLHMGYQSLASIVSRQHNARAETLTEDGLSANHSQGLTDQLLGAGGLGVGLAAGAGAIVFAPLAATLLGYGVGALGIFGYNQYLTRTQLAHPIRYTPLTLQGKAMIGGLPSRYVDGSFGASAKRWFKKSAKAIPLYLDDMYDKVIDGKWIRPRGTPNTLGEHAVDFLLGG